MNSRRLLSLLLLTLGTTALSQSATMVIPGMGRMLAGDGSRQSLTCKGDAVTVSIHPLKDGSRGGMYLRRIRGRAQIGPHGTGGG